MIRQQYDARSQQTIIGIPDRFMAQNQEQILRMATNEVINVLVKQGLKALQKPHVHIHSARKPVLFWPASKRTSRTS